MKNLSMVPVFSLAMAFVLSIASVALAHDDGEPKRKQSKRGPEFRQRVLERFDADGDGELNDDERSEARKEMRRRKERGSKFRQQMLEKFDADNNGELSDDEWAVARKAMQRRRKERSPKGKDGLIPERGPRRDFERPLQNEDGSPSRGPRADKERRDGRNHRRRDSGKTPDPNKVFDRFDANSDGQLSREEFRELAKTMHRMRGGHKGHRMGKGHGKRPGAPEGRRPGRRHDSAEGNSDRPRNRRPSGDDRDGTSIEANPVQDDSV